MEKNDNRKNLLYFPEYGGGEYGILPSEDTNKNKILESIKSIIKMNRTGDSVDDYIYYVKPRFGTPDFEKGGFYGINVWNVMNYGDPLFEICSKGNNYSTTLRIYPSDDFSSIEVRLRETPGYGVIFGHTTESTVGTFKLAGMKAAENAQKEAQDKRVKQAEETKAKKAQANFDDNKINISFPAVFKKSQGKGAGLYAVTAILDDKRQTRILSKEDVQKYFSLDKEGKQNFAFELADKYLVKDPGKERIAEAKENFEKAMDEHLEQQGKKELAAESISVTLVGEHRMEGNLFKDEKGRYYVDCNNNLDMHNPVTLYRLSPATDPDGEPDVLIENIKVLNPLSEREARMKQYSFDYMMLDRLRGDMEAYLNKPGDCRYHNKADIWGKDPELLVTEMRNLWNKIPADIKPEWLTEEKLKGYETAVSNEDKVSSFLEKIGEATDGKEYNMYDEEVADEEEQEISRGFHR